MKVKTRILAGFMASIFMLSSVSGNVSAASHDHDHNHDHAVTAVGTPLIGISTKDASDLVKLNSGDYLDAYKATVSSYTADGSQGDLNELEKVFDNDWQSAWKATDNTQASSITVSFDEINKISRILYGVRSNAYDPNGYPTKLAIAVSKTDNDDDFVEVAATTSEATLNKVLFTLSEPVEAKRIKFIFQEAHKGFASAAELMFLKTDPLMETVDNLFKDEASRQLKEEYQNDDIFDTLEAQAEKHLARNYLVDKIRFARKVFTGEITAEDPIDFPIEVIQKTGPDSEKYVMLFLPDRYTIDQQDKFYEDIKWQIQELMKREPFKSYADEFNIYALKVPSNQNLPGKSGNNYTVDSYFETIEKHSGIKHITNNGEKKLHELIKQIEENYLDKGGKISAVDFSMNTKVDGGTGIQSNNLSISLHSTIDQPYVMIHEMAHIVGFIGDEYPLKAIESDNVVRESDGYKAPWKEFMDFRGVSHDFIIDDLYRPSSYCLINNSKSLSLCEWCKLLTAERINQKIANKREMYIAEPRAAISIEQYYNYQKQGSTLMENGTYKKEEWIELNNNNITTANEKSVQYRTVVKNFTEQTKNLTLKMYRIDSKGEKTQLGSKDFTVNPSEIKSLDILSEKLSGLQQGDRISGELIDKDTGTVLMNGDTYLKKYGTVTIKHKVGDENQKTDIDLPNVEQRTLTLEANSTYQLKPAEIKGYKNTGKSITEVFYSSKRK